MPRIYTRRPIAERFWEKVDRSAGPDGCWPWLAFINPKGYGQFQIESGRPCHAHRMAYELVIGPIPQGLQIDHLCRNRACSNPRHLEAVTQRENILRGTAPSAIHARKTHCIHGHAFDEENTYIRIDNGGRMCNQCKRDRRAGYRARGLMRH